MFIDKLNWLKARNYWVNYQMNVNAKHSKHVNLSMRGATNLEMNFKNRKPSPGKSIYLQCVTSLLPFPKHIILSVIADTLREFLLVLKKYFSKLAIHLSCFG